MLRGFVGVSMLWLLSAAQASVVEAIAAHQHMGVASCASSVCHGASQRFEGSRIWQNEFAIWQERDPHSGAYRTLLNDESRAIARKLGIGAAHEAKICLDCHADNVPESKRGERFQISDGVGCEACHGGSERWLSSHAERNVPHADNLALGMYPTADPVRRAELCLSCHMGSRDRMITHRIMGAGHPRLAFELDTFTWMNPHYEIDDDYVARKGEVNGIRDWGVGQGVAAANLLDILLDERHGSDGIFPELVLFDCHACHRPMSGQRWTPRPGTGLAPGVVRLNDSNLVMFRHVLSAIDDGARQRLLEQTRALHAATTRDRAATLAAARTLRTTLAELLPRVAQFPFGSDTLGRVLDSIVADGDRGEYADFAGAEQAAMAVSSLLAAFESLAVVDEAQVQRLQGRLDSLYTTLDNEDNYSMQRFMAALREVRAAAR
jgi:hypothetical protein